MEQFLAIGLTTTLVVEKQDAMQYNITLQAIKERLTQADNFSENIYDFSEDTDNWTWTLKDEIIKTNFIPFLEDYFPQIDPKNKREYKNYLTFLKKNPPKDLNAARKVKDLYTFRTNAYGGIKYLSFDDKPFRPSIDYSFEAIMLGMEGKIAIESYGNFFSLWVRAMQCMFVQHPISAALRIYITKQY
jgi:hypothetical protein